MPCASQEAHPTRERCPPAGLPARDESCKKPGGPPPDDLPADTGAGVRRLRQMD